MKCVDGDLEAGPKSHSYRYKGSQSTFYKFVRLLRSFAGLYRKKMVVKAGVFGAVFALLWLYFAYPLPLVLLAEFAIYLATGGWNYIRLAIKTFPRDFK